MRIQKRTYLILLLTVITGFCKTGLLTQFLRLQSQSSEPKRGLFLSKGLRDKIERWRTISELESATDDGTTRQKFNFSRNLFGTRTATFFVDISSGKCQGLEPGSLKSKSRSWFQNKLMKKSKKSFVEKVVRSRQSSLFDRIWRCNISWKKRGRRFCWNQTR